MAEFSDGHQLVTGLPKPRLPYPYNTYVNRNYGYVYRHYSYAHCRNGYVYCR